MAIHLLERKRRILLVVALSAMVGLLSAMVNAGVGGLHPPGQQASELQIAAATTHVLVDMPSPSVVDRRVLPPELETLVKHTELLGRVMVSPPVLELIARRAGVPPDRLSGIARTTANVPLALSEPGSELRASEIEGATFPYRLEVQARPTTPILDIYAMAPSTAEAQRLGNAAILGLRDYLTSLAQREAFPEEKLANLRQLGSARGSVVNPGAQLSIAVLTFLVAFTLSCAAMFGALLLWRRRAGALAATHAPDEDEHGPRDDAVRLTSTADARGIGDWPRTTRVLPWMLAAFLAMLWLVPFNDIQLNASLPIDLKLDRLVLPFIVALWALALAMGGRLAPRLRLSGIHVALGVFVAFAFLGVVLNARYLNQTGELELSVKKLPLLVSYATLFVIAASAVRRSEIRPFMTYTLVLAVICGVGIVWEYRFKQNLFYIWSDKLLPGTFSVGSAESAAVDHIGRRLVRGPAEVGLEAVTMLSLALPIALVGFVHTDRWRGRILYGLATCALVAGMFATYRKSALLAPISVGLTLAYFRRRELLKLAPLALVLVVIVQVLSPGALSSTVNQFTRSDRSAVPTVSDRTSDYDAIRPDVWSHVAVGRGYGSYDHNNYRILDSEILYRTIETGVIGLVLFLLVAASVVLVSRKTIASRDPSTAPLALIGAAGAVAFIVVATLYDVMAYPHAVYIFLYMAGFVAVAVERRLDPEPDETRVAHAPRHARRGHRHEAVAPRPARRATSAR